MFFFKAFDYYQDDAVIPETPIFNIQAGANGELYAEPDPSMSFHPSQDPHSAYMDAGYTVDYSVHEEQVKQKIFVEFYWSMKISLRLMKTMIPLSSSLALVEEWWESSMSMGLGQEMGR